MKHWINARFHYLFNLSDLTYQPILLLSLMSQKWTSIWPPMYRAFLKTMQSKRNQITLNYIHATQIIIAVLLLYTDALVISSRSASIVESRSSLPSRERHCWDLAGENQIVNLSIGRLNIKALNSIKQKHEKHSCTNWSMINAFIT